MAQITLNDAINFSRPTRRDVIDENGNLAELAIDAPAIDHNPITLERRGISLEPHTHNGIQSAHDFTDTVYWYHASPTNAAWGSSVVTSEVSGKIPNLFRITANAGDGREIFGHLGVNSQRQPGVAIVNSDGTFIERTNAGKVGRGRINHSIVLKRGNHDHVKFANHVDVDLGLGVITRHAADVTNVRADDLGDGFLRVSFVSGDVGSANSGDPLVHNLSFIDANGLNITCSGTEYVIAGCPQVTAGRRLRSIQIAKASDPVAGITYKQDTAKITGLLGKINDTEGSFVFSFHEADEIVIGKGLGAFGRISSNTPGRATTAPNDSVVISYDAQGVYLHTQPDTFLSFEANAIEDIMEFAVSAASSEYATYDFYGSATNRTRLAGMGGGTLKRLEYYPTKLTAVQINSIVGGLVDDIEPLVAGGASLPVNMEAFFQHRGDMLTFPLISFPGVTSIKNTWQYCNNLDSFPGLDFTDATTIEGAWSSAKITKFGQITAPLATTAVNAWYQSKVEVVAPLNLPAVTNMSGAFSNCSQLTNLGILQLPSANNLKECFYYCTSLVDFPAMQFAVDTDPGTSAYDQNHGFYQAFRYCSSLVNFPAGVFDNCKTRVYAYAFEGCALNQQSVDNILVSIKNSAETYLINDGALHVRNGTSAAPSATGLAAADTLRARGWTVYTN